VKKYKNIITLSKNSRGCYILDTIKGCSGCNNVRPLGCYDNCYAKNIADRYGFDFTNITKRNFTYDNEQIYILDFYDNKHENLILQNIKNINMPFIRIGEMGDPSENWEHTINVCKIISKANKPIVIITKHLKSIPQKILSIIDKLNICINTSISALDNDNEIKYRLKQYDVLKHHCKSILRIVSCDFNKHNTEGHKRAKTQDELFKNDFIIDTIFRPRLNNKLVLNNIIKIRKIKFLKSTIIASVFNENTYFGFCDNCPDMCGIRY